jgi:hypothetical protein
MRAARGRCLRTSSPCFRAAGRRIGGGAEVQAGAGWDDPSVSPIANPACGEPEEIQFGNGRSAVVWKDDGCHPASCRPSWVFGGAGR